MNIICNGTQLSEALTRVIKALPVKKTIPILEGVKLSAYGNTLTLTATDTELAIQKTINADVKIEGEALVPGKLFGELIKKLSSEDQSEISFDDDQTVVIKYMDSVTSIKAMKLRDYPPIQEFEYETEFEMLQKDFKDMIIKTIFSAATDDVRPVLKGCLLELEGEEARCVALDGYRLAISKKKIGKTMPYTAAIVPAKNLSEIYKLLEEDEETAKISICQKKIAVDLKHTKIISNLLSGTYMKYASSIPTNFETTITISKDMLERCLERAYVMSRFEKSNLVKLDIKEGKLTVSTASEYGDINEVIAVFTEGKEVQMLFNSKFILDCLKVIEDEYVKIRFSTPTSPSVIVPVDGDTYLYMILPLRNFSR